MARSFAHSALVVLPRLNALSALGLLRATLSAAEAAGKLPAPVEEARAEVLAAHDSLGEAIREKGIPAAESRDARELDLQLDSAWSGFFSWAAGLAKLPPGVPEAAKATAILERVFPDGLKFLKLPYAIEWGESESRLHAIKKEKLEGVIVELGGRCFLGTIRDAHDAYGQGLGITAAATPAQEQSNARLRDALDEAMDSLRTYVVRVSAHVRKSDPKTAQLASALLAPITAWKSAGSGREGDQPASPAPVDPEHQ